jgi:CHAT domain-containing protein
MLRKLHILAVVAVFLGWAQPSGAQSPSTPSSQASPDEAERLSKLAGKLSGEGSFREAVPLAEQSLAIWEKTLGPGHPKVAQSLRSLAWLYQSQGEYEKAEPLLVRALDIFEKTLGPTHPDVASSLNHLAELYAGQGAYAKAEPLLVRARDILEKTLGPMHPEVARSLNHLAEVYAGQGAYAKAEPLLVRARDILEKTLGPTHPEVARSLNHLAELYKAQGAYAKAEPLLVRALNIKEKALGPVHPDVAVSLAQLAAVYEAQGAYGRAEPLHRRTLDLKEKALGPTHPAVADSLNHLAALYRAQGAYARAVPLEQRAAEVREAQLRAELSRLSPSRERSLMALLRGETERIVSLHADSMPANPQALELALTTVLRRKGRALDASVDNQARLRAHLSAPLREKLDQLARARTELSTRLRSPADPRAPKDRDTAIATLRARIDELEAVLSAASAEFLVPSEPVTLAKIRAALPRDAALVEFVRYHRFDARQASHGWQEEHYVAYLVTAQGPPQWVALGKAAPIDAAVDAVLAAMPNDGSPEAARAALQRLDVLVFAPIRTRLANVSHVILAPDGKLNLVPFEALLDPQGHYELEQRLMSYVTTGRDLLRLAAPHAPRSPAVIVAAPEFGPLPSAASSSAASFAPLPGALAEATDLQSYFPHPPLTGGKATKQALSALTGPAILHVATHGFYTRAPITPPTGLLPPPSDDPAEDLDRAGLAMAGANQGAGGIVTAREIAGFDWWGTQLVVLSACETGVGAVASGDGVYGLRRALLLSGAESQVVSLWNVDDLSTRELMRDYYGELARGTGRAEALRQAQLRLMRQPRYAHPSFWAAFIPAGDWRPLDKNVFSARKP